MTTYERRGGGRSPSRRLYVCLLLQFIFPACPASQDKFPLLPRVQMKSAHRERSIRRRDMMSMRPQRWCRMPFITLAVLIRHLRRLQPAQFIHQLVAGVAIALLLRCGEWNARRAGNRRQRGRGSGMWRRTKVVLLLELACVETACGQRRAATGVC